MRHLLGILVLVGLVAYLLTGLTQIRPGERGVVRRFGRVVDKPGPGLWVGFPAGIDRVDRVAVDRVQRVLVGYQPEGDEASPSTPLGQLLTGDQNLVNLQVLLDYAVRADEVEDYVVQMDRADGLIARIAESVLAEWVAGHTVDDVLLQGKAVLPEVLVRQTQRRLEPYRLGVEIQGASVAHLFPPDEVRAAFDEVTRAQTAIRTREHEARQEAARRLREAQAEKYRTERLTAAYVQERVLLAHTEAETFAKRLRQYQQLRRDNPDFLAGIWWDEMAKLFTRLKDNGRIDLLDNHLGSDGLDITVSPPLPRKR
ncbi:MAG: protease modulator HflK [Gemmataceae bacterium]|nr:protease modulator HflK [Gemmataceae bacterium]